MMKTVFALLALFASASAFVPSQTGGFLNVIRGTVSLATFSWWGAARRALDGCCERQRAIRAADKNLT